MRTACAMMVVLSFGLGAIAPLGSVYADSYSDGMIQQGIDQYYRYEEQNRRGIAEQERVMRERAEEQRRNIEQYDAWMRSEREKRDREQEASRSSGESSWSGVSDGVSSELLGLAIASLFFAAMSEATQKHEPAPAAPQGGGSMGVTAPSRETAPQPQQTLPGSASLRSRNANASPEVSSATPDDTANTDEITDNSEETDRTAVEPSTQRPSAWRDHSRWERRYYSDRPYALQRDDRYDRSPYYRRWSRLQRQYRAERRYRLHRRYGSNRQFYRDFPDR